MKEPLSFTQLGKMSAIELNSMIAEHEPQSEQHRMIAYELRIREIELPQEWKLNNSYHNNIFSK